MRRSSLPRFLLALALLCAGAGFAAPRPAEAAMMPPGVMYAPVPYVSPLVRQAALIGSRRALLLGSGIHWWRNCASLDLDFYNDRYYVNSNTTCDGTVGTTYSGVANFISGIGATFTRAGNGGTYYNSAGVLKTAPANTPRLDHDPVTHAPKGVLIEEQRSNLVVGSGAIGNGTWSLNDGETSVSLNAAMAPDGTSSATLLSDSSSSAGTGVVNQTYSSLSGTYTATVYGKSGSLSSLNVQPVISGGGGSASCNLSNGTINSASAYGTGLTYVSSQIAAIGSGWYRCSFTFTLASSTAVAFWIGNLSSVGNVYVWGAQLEAGAFATSYIPTNGSTVTRSQENFTLPTSGSWFSPTRMTVLATVGAFPSNLGAYVFNFYQNTNPNANRMSFGTDTNNRFSYRIFSGGTMLCGADNLSLNNGSNKYSVGMISGNEKFYTDYNNTPTLQDSCAGLSLPITLTTLGLGSNGYNGSYMDQDLSRLTYFPVRLPDSALSQFSQ